MNVKYYRDKFVVSGTPEQLKAFDEKWKLYLFAERCNFNKRW